MVRFLSVLFLLAVQFVAAADITITGPTKPINPGRMVRLLISGLSEQELMRSSASVSRRPQPDDPVSVTLIGKENPLDGVDIFPGKTWDNRPYIDFMSQSRGTFLITIDVNLFRRELDEGFSATEAATIEPPELLSELRIVVTKITDKYQAKSGSALVEVAGTVPPPDPPDVPPLPASGLVWTIVIRTVDTMTADQSEVLSNLRQWTDQQPFDKVAHYEFSPNAIGPSGERDVKVATWVAKMPATAKQPYVFVAQKGTDGKTAIVWQGDLPAKADDVIAKIKERVQ